MSGNKLVPIGEAAKILGVSIDTLRRWDASGRLRAERTGGGHRLYSRFQLELQLTDLFKRAEDWAQHGSQIPQEWYCENSARFQARLSTMERQLSLVEGLSEIYPLIVAITGEIGNNSFDHNLGNWPDTPGIFFGYDTGKRRVVLADRGRGVLATLSRVKPELRTDAGALRVAFTEVLSGRAPENRGNGLKFVRKVVANTRIGLLFHTGNAELDMTNDGNDLPIREATDTFRGCLALITF